MLVNESETCLMRERMLPNPNLKADRRSRLVSAEETSALRVLILPPESERKGSSLLSSRGLPPERKGSSLLSSRGLPPERKGSSLLSSRDRTTGNSLDRVRVSPVLLAPLRQEPEAPSPLNLRLKRELGEPVTISLGTGDTLK